MHRFRTTLPRPRATGSERTEAVELRTVRQFFSLVARSETVLLIDVQSDPRVPHRPRADQQHRLQRGLQVHRSRLVEYLNIALT